MNTRDSFPEVPESNPIKESADIFAKALKDQVVVSITEKMQPLKNKLISEFSKELDLAIGAAAMDAATKVVVYFSEDPVDLKFKMEIGLSQNLH